jgi:V/A-type H+-transporting ATPase subunit I
MRPLDHATTLLAVSVAIGAVLLACSYALGALNRLREGGVARALVALSGIAGAALYLGLALAGAGWYWHRDAVILLGAVLTAAALAMGFFGLFIEAGGRASGALEAGVELFDAVLRLGTNTVSFARLAAFGLTHAALSSLVWSGTASLWRTGGVFGVVAAALVFAVGNALTFALEALVAGVQALRLEYYEIFSRVFTAEGREFHPWHVTVRQ